MSTIVTYKGNTIASITNSSATLTTQGKYLEANILIDDVTSPNLQSKSVTPTESAQSILPDSGYDGLSQVDVGAISSTYIGTGIYRSLPFTPAVSFNSATGVFTASNTFMNAYYLSGSTSASASIPLKSKNNVSNLGYKISVPSGYYSSSFGLSMAYEGYTPTLEGQYYITPPEGYYGLYAIDINPIPQSYFQNVSSLTVTPSSASQTFEQRVNTLGTITGVDIPTYIDMESMPSGKRYEIFYEYGYTSTDIQGSGSDIFIFNGEYHSFDDNDIGLTIELGWDDDNNQVVIFNCYFSEYESFYIRAILYRLEDFLGYTPVTIVGDANLIPSNIVSGVSIFGVVGTFNPEPPAPVDPEELNKILTRTISGTYSNSTISEIGSQAFGFCSQLESVNFPNCTIIERQAFTNCSKLTTLSFPNCATISGSAFWYCGSLISVDFPNCTKIYDCAFTDCTKLTTISFPSCTLIGTSAFQQCYSLINASFPNCQSISSYAFSDCNRLTTISFPKCKSLQTQAFYRCSSLISAIFPSCSSIAAWVFNYCSSLTLVDFSVCTTIGTSAFGDCTALISTSFPQCTIISNYAFAKCTNLSTISFPSASVIYPYGFQSCYKLSSLYLLGSSVCKLSAATAFYSTPISTYSTLNNNQYGKIYVPSSLYSTYIASTNWVTYSARFVSV